MQIELQQFQGEFPRVGNQILPQNAAKEAVNARLLSGNLTPWADFGTEEPLCKAGTVNSVHLMDGQYWLEWTEAELGAGQVSVDAVRGPIAQDVTERTIFTGTDAPRVTNIELATGESGCYPQDSYLLGVPAPDTAPELIVNGSTAPANQVTLANPGAETGNITGWVSTGDFTALDNTDIPGLTAQAGNFFFGGGAVALSTFYQDIPIGSSGVAPGQQVELAWYQAHGANDSTAFMELIFLDGSMVEVGRINSTPAAALGADNTWVQRTVGGAVVMDTETIRVMGTMTRVGGGDNDSYVDSITLQVTNSDYSSDGSDLDQWERSPEESRRQIAVTDVGGSNGDVFNFLADERTNYIYKNFSLLSTSAFTIEYDFYKLHERNLLALSIGCTASGAGEGIAHARYSTALQRRDFGNHDDQGSGIVEIEPTSGGSPGVWYHVVITGTKSGTASATCECVTNIIGSPATNTSSFTVDLFGDFIEFKHYSNEGGPTAHIYLDNIAVTTVPAIAGEENVPVFTSYVFTYVNGFGEEGPPSPVSRIIQSPDGGSVTVTTPTTPPDTEYNIQTKRIYRLVTGPTSSDYQFVDEIPLAQADYEDDKLDVDLGEILQTVDWDLPPTDGAGVIALPNGVTAMFSKNQVCLSVINRPHAYPQAYRVNFETEVVGICPLDTSIIVGTRSNPYIVLGSDPSQVSSSKFEQRQACVSKRSMVGIREYGVLYASPDGLVSVTSAGNLTLVTEGYFSRKEWQALNPSSIIAFTHDDRYFAFYDNGTPGGFLFDPRNLGNGLTMLDFNAIAGFSDPVTDKLYLHVEGALLPWDDGVTPLAYSWRSKEFQLPRAANFNCAQIRGTFPATITFRLYSDGVLVYTKSVTSEQEFLLPAYDSTKVEVEVEASTEIRKIAIAEGMEELT